jgi:hypothetical protein
MDLLATYTHHSELQIIAEVSLVSTLCKSPQHPLGPFPACCVISRTLAAASSSGDSSASHARICLRGLSCRTRLSLSTDWVAPIVGTGNIEDTVSNSSSVVVEACSPRRCITTAVVSLLVSKPLPSNWSIPTI